MSVFLFKRLFTFLATLALASVLVFTVLGLPCARGGAAASDQSPGGRR